MTGKELYELLQTRLPDVFWVVWDAVPDRIRKAMDEVTDVLNEIQGEAIFAATAGEDI